MTITHFIFMVSLNVAVQAARKLQDTPAAARVFDPLWFQTTQKSAAPVLITPYGCM